MPHLLGKRLDWLPSKSYNNNRCNPSFALTATDPDDNQSLHFQTLFAIEALSYGWYVSIADDGGPQASQREYNIHRYLDPPLAADIDSFWAPDGLCNFRQYTCSSQLNKYYWHQS
jgi:hypothetical protein